MIKGGRKTFHDKSRLKEFITTKIAIEETRGKTLKRIINTSKMLQGEK